MQARGTDSGTRPRFVLASGSPRRRELLSALGLSFDVRPVDLDETPGPGEPAAHYVERLARAKAEAAVHRGELVLAADTAVLLTNELLVKPADELDAKRMLAQLAGEEHEVLTGIALAEDGRPTLGTVERSLVEIAPLDRHEIDWYVATGEPLDKAGAYAIQGLGALFVERVSGNYTNVVGLPLPAVNRLLRQRGYDLRDFLRNRES
jgi:septum formation protein